MTGEQALREIARLRADTPDGHKESPETPEQRERVRTWSEGQPRPEKGGVSDLLRGVAVGAAVGDALGMPLEFGPAIPAHRLVRAMQPGRLPAGSFTDDTEMALALADSLLAARPLDPADLAARFAAWYAARPPDVGVQTSLVLRGIAQGLEWRDAVRRAEETHPNSAGNGSVMRCWPVAVAYWNDLPGMLAASRVQSEVTHAHPDCVAGSAFVNAVIYHLLQGVPRGDAVAKALTDAPVANGLRQVIEAAPRKRRDQLSNSGWVRHTLESAVWGLLTTNSFEEAVVQVVNLGSDADTAGTVVGALAGAAYGLSAIPPAWVEALQGKWPIRTGERWNADRLAALADCLSAPSAG
jgi:ADP-ribosyl-[dinitrogen reductase] hydrolase